MDRPIRTADDIDVSDRLQVSVRNGKEPLAYVSRVLDIDEESIAIDAPLEGGTSVPLPNGTDVDVFIRRENGEYQFETTVVGWKAGRLPFLMIRKPEQDQILRIQRRKDFRVPTSVPVTVRWVYFEEKKIRKKVFEGTILDISAGGALIRTEEPIEPGAKLILDFEFPQEFYEANQYVSPEALSGIRGEVRNVRAVREKTDPSSGEEMERYFSGIMFLDLTQAATNQLLRYSAFQQRKLLGGNGQVTSKNMAPKRPLRRIRHSTAA